MNSTHISDRQELDLAIPNLDSARAETAAKMSLKGHPGIHAVRIIERGMWIEYDAAITTPENICGALRHDGFRAGLFQDSGTGRTGVTSV